jgi:hypothetical protein
MSYIKVIPGQEIPKDEDRILFYKTFLISGDDLIPKYWYAIDDIPPIETTKEIWDATKALIVDSMKARENQINEKGFSIKSVDMKTGEIKEPEKLIKP